MEVKKNTLDLYQIQLGIKEQNALSHCALITGKSSDYLLEKIFSLSLELLMLGCQIFESYKRNFK